MRRLIELTKIAKNSSWINEILEVFEPLLTLIGVDDEFFAVKKNEFSELSRNEKRFLIHPWKISLSISMESLILFMLKTLVSMIIL